MIILSTYTFSYLTKIKYYNNVIKDILNLPKNLNVPRMKKYLKIKTGDLRDLTRFLNNWSTIIMMVTATALAILLAGLIFLPRGNYNITGTDPNDYLYIAVGLWVSLCYCMLVLGSFLLNHWSENGLLTCHR